MFIGNIAKIVRIARSGNIFRGACHKFKRKMTLSNLMTS